MDLSRREFTVLGVSALSGSNLQLDQQGQPNSQYDFQGVAFLMGPDSAKPGPDDSFWDNKVQGLYIYENFEGTRYAATVDSKTWTPINWTNNVFVSSSDDLPDPTNGTHTLENKVYWFVGFVDSPYGLDISNSPVLLGRHGGADGFIHTGTNTALTGTDGGFFARNCYFHSPGGTMFDLSADSSTEMLVESCAFSDAAGIGNIASLGTLDGYRVQTFKGVNFEDFDGGLTLTGPTTKTFFEGCPFRNISASGVTIIQTDSNYQGELLKVSTDCYIKQVQSDTEVVRVPAGGEPSNYFKYFNVDHPDGTVTTSNILNGEVGVNKVGSIVRNSFPLAESAVVGELNLESQVTVTGSGSAPTEVTQGTWSLIIGERMSQASAGILEYDAKFTENIKAEVRITVLGSNTEFALWVGRNGSVIPSSRVESSTSSASKPVTVRPGAIITDPSASAPDQFSVFLENIGGTADLDVSEATLEVTEL